jgi:hypothetical protein
MDFFKRLHQIENKSFCDLSEQDKLIWNYCILYKEANLYYNLMNNSYYPDLAMSYAEKGRAVILKAIDLKNKILTHSENTATVHFINFPVKKTKSA